MYCLFGLKAVLEEKLLMIIFLMRVCLYLEEHTVYSFFKLSYFRLYLLRYINWIRRNHDDRLDVFFVSDILLKTHRFLLYG